MPVVDDGKKMHIYDLWGGQIGLFGMAGSVAGCFQALSRSIPPSMVRLGCRGIGECRHRHGYSGGGAWGWRLPDQRTSARGDDGRLRKRS